METYRIQPDASLYYVTYSVVEWLPVFVSEDACRIVTDSLTFCHRENHLRVNAYVIMPTHMHAIVFDAEHKPERLAKTLDQFRRFTGRNLADFCVRHMPLVFTEVFQDSATQDRKRRFWQPSRHPVALQSEKFWRQRIDYLHANPCRKGLVLYAGDWRFSSARYYANGKDESPDVPIAPLSW